MNRLVYVAAVIFIVLVAFYWLVLNAMGADVSSVTVHFGDGTSQKFVPEPATQPTPPVIVPAPPGSIEFAPGSANLLVSTLNPRSGTWVRTTPPGEPAVLRVASPAGRNLDAIYAGNQVRDVLISDLIVENDKKVSRAVNADRSTNVRVSNVRQNGVGVALEFTGSTGLYADRIIAAGDSGEYGIKAFGAEFTPPRLNRDCTIARFVSIYGRPDAGHSMRIGHARNLRLGDTALRWPTGSGDATGWAGYSKATGWVAACALNMKDSIGVTIERCRFDGPVGFNAGLPTDEPAHPDWRIAELVIVNCEFNTPGYVALGPGVVGASFKNTRMRAIERAVNGDFDVTRLKGACLRLDGQLGAWPAASGRFEDCEFEGERLTEASNVPNLKNFTFVNCGFTGPDGARRPIGATGGLNP